MKADKKAVGRTWVDSQPATLQQAHDVLRRERPDATAAPKVLLAYQQKAARIYASVADVDADHHFEALHFASIAREDAQKLMAAVEGEK